ncbi:hypothetical protein FJ364_04335 [Candidatus Dependentiae bacterium]|nr:hypothetical protein [Candidatus Dependentiae bacterium]
MEYPKINSLFKRNVSDNTLIIGDYACPEFGLLKAWRVEEKIDGTNIRIVYDPLATKPEAKLAILGRSKDSAMPTQLHEWLKNHFTLDRVEQVFAGAKANAPSMVKATAAISRRPGPTIKNRLASCFSMCSLAIGG